MLKDKPKMRNKELKLRLNNVSVEYDDRNFIDNSPCDTIPVRNRLNN